MKGTLQLAGILLNTLLLLHRIEAVNAACHTCVHCEDAESDTRVLETEPTCLKTVTTVGKYVKFTKLTTTCSVNTTRKIPKSRLSSPYELEEDCNEAGGQEEICSDNGENCNMVTTDQLTYLGTTITTISYFFSLTWMINAFLIPLIRINIWGVIWKFKDFMRRLPKIIFGGMFRLLLAPIPSRTSARR